MISVVQLGRVDYSTALKLQQTLVDLRKAGQIGDTLLLLEHPAVITLGRNAKRTNVLVSEDQLAQLGVEIFECDRGGDVTYHGPGQLIGYPIFDLRGFTPRLGAVEFVRKLEEALIRTCADFGVATHRVSGMTGAWTLRNEAKIAAIGVHISRGVTSHGFALNVSTGLDHFKLIIPCGIGDKPVTSLDRALGDAYPGIAVTPLTLTEVSQSVARNFGRVFDSEVIWVDTLDALLGRTVGVPMKLPENLRKLHDDENFWT
ncbi:MAG: lipoyl(octanoyl) transferase LipB [Terriglobales bacterium]